MSQEACLAGGKEVRAEGMSYSLEKKLAKDPVALRQRGDRRSK